MLPPSSPAFANSFEPARLERTDLIEYSAGGKIEVTSDAIRPDA